MPLKGFKQEDKPKSKGAKQIADSQKRVGYRDSAGIYKGEMYRVEVDEETGLAVLPYDPDWEE